MSLSGQVIVITGASSGIGADLAKYAASNGAQVVLAARRLDALETVALECGDKENYLVHQCDVTKRADHQSLLSASLTKFGKVSVWINNAGLGMAKPVLALTDEDVDLMINVNTKSVLYGMQTAIPYFKEKNEGILINISSILARFPSGSIRAMYSASKAAVNSLTVNARVDVQNEGFKNIHVCLFSPGAVATEFSAHAVGDYVDKRVKSYVHTPSEISELLVKMILNPSESYDVYSNPAYKQAVLNYYGAENVKSVEEKAPFASQEYLDSIIAATSTANDVV